MAKGIEKQEQLEGASVNEDKEKEKEVKKQGGEAGEKSEKEKQAQAGLSETESQRFAFSTHAKRSRIKEEGKDGKKDNTTTEFNCSGEAPTVCTDGKLEATKDAVNAVKDMSICTLY